MLAAWLIAGVTVAHAAPMHQTDPAAQCVEGVRLFDAGRAAEARPPLEAGFAGREGATFAKPDDLGRCAVALGVLRDHAGDRRAALEAYAVALEIFHRNGNRAFEGVTLSNIGTDYDYQGRYAEALETLHQALAIRREIGDRSGEGVTLSNIGTVYEHQGRSAEALESYQQALAIVREIGDRRAEGTTLNNIGAIHTSQGRFAEALESYRQALAIARQGGDRHAEGTALGNIGAVYHYQGRYAEALDAYQQALAIRREVGDRQGEGNTLNNIGGVYNDQGRYAEALDAYQQALAIAQAVGDRPGEGAALYSIGAALVAQGRYGEALATLQQALALRREVGDRPGEGSTLTGIGAIYDYQGRMTEALESYQQALAIQREVGDRAGEATTLDNIGGIYEAQGRYAEALDAAKQALAILREIGDRAGEGLALSNIGFAYERQGDSTQALAHYTQAMEMLEAVRAEAGSEQGRAGFIAQHADVYQHAALLYHQQGQDDLAFLASKRGRARAFLDSLATSQVQLSDQESAALLERERETYVERQAAQDALARARAVLPADPALVADLDKQLTAAEQAHSQALAAIARHGDALAALVPGRKKAVLDRATVQQHLDFQTTLVAFFVSEDQTLAFVMTHDHFTTHVLPIGRDTLRDQVRALLDNPTFQQQSHPPEGLALYTALIAPLKPYLTTPHVAIIPHGPLHYLPWAALSDGKRYLIEDYIVSTLPSASVLPLIQANTGHPLTAPLILGNPDGTLRFAEQEARAVASLYEVQPLIGGQATKDALQKRVREAGIVHLATHAAFDPNVPLASSITLAPSLTSTVRLEASEVYSLDLHRADLVVLSACQTNLGDVSAGDEVVGLTRAFFFAGTPTVISSLWSVDDAATSLIMEHFYTHLRAGMGKAEALRQAQMDVRAQYPAPYYWAGFVLAGDAGDVREPLPWMWLGSSGALAVLMIGLAWILLHLHRRVVAHVPGMRL
jgi:CHAT domain-containing protein/tetratricopeptide (TPR) repeat protein